MAEAAAVPAHQEQQVSLAVPVQLKQLTLAELGQQLQGLPLPTTLRLVMQIWALPVKVVGEAFALPPTVQPEVRPSSFSPGEV